MPSSHTVSDASLSTDQTVHQPPFYYQLAIGLLKPLYRLQVWRRSHKRDNYQQEVDQRFGKKYPPVPMANNHNLTISPASQPIVDKGVVWCHAVSLGETNTVAPLLDLLMANGYRIWLTNTTQTGFARAASRFTEAIAGAQMSHSYVPVDSPVVIERFLAHVTPTLALFIETELWANILTKLSEHRIPSILVNGRLSVSSFTRYQKITAVSSSMMKNLALIIAQDKQSAKRFRQLGATSARIRVAGSLKWVINSPPDHKAHDKVNPHSPQKPELAAMFGVANRPIWVAASTHRDEEKIVLDLHKQLICTPALANALLIIVPRHPERFDEVAVLIKSTALTMAQRSAASPISAQTQVYLADSMGELMTWYQLANVALVGGTLVDIGGHNPVEAVSVATPVIMGRYTQSCQTVVDNLSAVGALYQPNNACYRAITSDLCHADATTKTEDDVAAIYRQLHCWLTHPNSAKQAGAAGAQLTIEKQNILLRQFTMIEDVMMQHASRGPA